MSMREQAVWVPLQTCIPVSLYRVRAEGGGYANVQFIITKSDTSKYYIGVFTGRVTIGENTSLSGEENTQGVFVILTDDGERIQWVRQIWPVPLYSDGDMACALGENGSVICVFTRSGTSYVRDERERLGDTLYAEGMAAIKLQANGKTGWWASLGKGWAEPKTVIERGANEIYVDAAGQWDTGCNDGQPYSPGRCDGRFVIERSGDEANHGP
jgi:hypothetical protein